MTSPMNTTSLSTYCKQLKPIVRNETQSTKELMMTYNQLNDSYNLYRLSMDIYIQFNKTISTRTSTF